MMNGLVSDWYSHGTSIDPEFLLPNNIFSEISYVPAGNQINLASINTESGPYNALLAGMTWPAIYLVVKCNRYTYIYSNY
jgi:hypothetical protein